MYDRGFVSKSEGDACKLLSYLANASVSFRGFYRLKDLGFRRIMAPFEGKFEAANVREVVAYAKKANLVPFGCLEYHTCNGSYANNPGLRIEVYPAKARDFRSQALAMASFARFPDINIQKIDLEKCPHFRRTIVQLLKEYSPMWYEFEFNPSQEFNGDAEHATWSSEGNLRYEHGVVTSTHPDEMKRILQKELQEGKLALKG